MTKKNRIQVVIKWLPEDVHTLREHWSTHQCEHALETISRMLSDRSIEAGWQILESLLDSYFLWDGTRDDVERTDDIARAQAYRGY